MKINHKDLESKLLQYLNSQQGQKKITQGYQALNKSGFSTGWTLDEITSMIERFKLYFASAMKTDFPGYDPRGRSRKLTNHMLLFGKTHIGNIKYSPIAKDRIISCTVALEFNPETIKRPSLVPKKYGYIKNIFMLKTHGYDYRRPGTYNWYNPAAKGKWRGETIIAETVHGGSPFMTRIIQRYNTTASKGVHVVLDNKYTTFGTYKKKYFQEMFPMTSNTDHLFAGGGNSTQIQLIHMGFKML